MRRKVRVTIQGAQFAGKTHLLRQLQGREYDFENDAQTKTDEEFKRFKVRTDNGVLVVKKGADRGGSVANADHEMVNDIRRANVIIYLFRLKYYLSDDIQFKERVDTDFQTIFNELQPKKQVLIVGCTYIMQDYSSKKESQDAVDEAIKIWNEKEWRDMIKFSKLVLLDTQKDKNAYLEIIKAIFKK